MRYLVCVLAVLGVLILGVTVASGAGKTIELGNISAYLCDGDHSALHATVGDSYKAVDMGESKGGVFSVPNDMQINVLRFGAFKTTTATGTYTYQLWNVNQSSQVPTSMIWESAGYPHNVLGTQPNVADVEQEGNPLAWHVISVPNVQIEGDTKYALVIHTNSDNMPMVIPRIARIFDANNVAAYADDGTACQYYAVEFDGTNWFVDFGWDAGIAVYGVNTANNSTVDAAKKTLVRWKFGDDLGYAVIVGLVMIGTLVAGVAFHWPPIGVVVILFMEMLGFVAIVMIQSIIFLTVLLVAGLAATWYFATKGGSSAAEDA